MPTQRKQEASIIEIIQKMVSDGESEEKIVKTLKALGVDEKKAKSLLLIGEADTFALLRSELTKIARNSIEQEMPKVQEDLKAEIDTQIKVAKEEVIRETITQMQRYEQDVTADISQFKGQEQEKINQLGFFGDKVKEKINELGEGLHTAQLDLDEMKVKGVSGINANARRLLLGLGIIFALVDLYLVYTGFSSTVSVDSIISVVLLAVLSVTMFFVAAVI